MSVSLAVCLSVCLPDACLSVVCLPLCCVRHAVLLCLSGRVCLSQTACILNVSLPRTEVSRALPDNITPRKRLKLVYQGGRGTPAIAFACVHNNNITHTVANNSSTTSRNSSLAPFCKDVPPSPSFASVALDAVHAHRRPAEHGVNLLLRGGILF